MLTGVEIKASAEQSGWLEAIAADSSKSTV